MARVGLIFGGRSVEHKVSVESARTVAAALAEAGHRVVPLAVAQDGCWVEEAGGAAALAGEVDRLAAVGEAVRSTVHRLLEAPIDVCFPITHGTWGEDGALQGLLEVLDLPYVGAGVTPSALSMDKWKAKLVLAAHGLPVVEFAGFTRSRFEADPQGCVAQAADLPFPLFVKPAVGGSSVGIRKVADRRELADALAFAFRFDDAAVVERGIDGRELECAVLGYREQRASVLGEIVAGRDFYDYQDKYLTDGAQLIAPAELPEELAERLRRQAVEAWQALGGWGMARVDFLVEPAAVAEPGDESVGGLYINEINTLPGFTAISMYPRLWELTGVPRPQLVDRLVEIAIERHRDRQRLDRGIGEWLAELG